MVKVIQQILCHVVEGVEVGEAEDEEEGKKLLISFILLGPDNIGPGKVKKKKVFGEMSSFSGSHNPNS